MKSGVHRANGPGYEQSGVYFLGLTIGGLWTTVCS